MDEIIQKENPILRKKSEEVLVGDIPSKKIQKIIASMKEALESQEDGVAIAAPQIGKNLRIFVMSKRVFDLVGTKPQVDKPFGDAVFVNPKITKLSRKKIEQDEGCLSVRYLYGKVMRAEKATIEAYDECGKKFVSGGSGLVAQIFQHECDHLDGVLFIDKAKDLQEIPPEVEKPLK
ncbi:MAG TPA: peptide deformylase [Candidatus Paceibacterota bacterium]